MKYMIKIRDEDGNWYLDWGPLTCWTSERHDARTFLTRAYADKIASIIRDQGTRPEYVRGPVRVIEWPRHREISSQRSA